VGSNFHGRERIYSHRGKGIPGHSGDNDVSSLIACLEMGFSLETDLRLGRGEVILSHDPLPDHASTLRQLLEGAVSFGAGPRLALDVKEDGLAPFLPEVAIPHFYFDLSVPEAVKFKSAGLPILGRLSEHEPLAQLELWTDLAGVWVDAFYGDWLEDEPTVLEWLESFAGEVIFVSPELHGRDHAELWAWLKDRWLANPNFGICSDFPLAFEEFVYG
jgi:hypothetical protein